MEPILQWVGGKKRLIKTLDLFTDNIDYNNYHEIFLGGGSYLFSLLPENTTSIEKNINTYKIYENVRIYLYEIIKLLENIEKEYLSKNYDNRKKFYYEKRDIFNKLKYDTKENNIEKTTLLLFINKTCFNAVYRENQKGFYNVPFGNGRDCIICNKERIVKVYNYLNKPNVNICNNDFEYIKHVAEENDLVYIDPPYYPLKVTSFTSYTNDGFSLKEHDRLIELIKYLHEKKVKIILSNSNNDYFKTKLNFLNIYEISIARTLNCKKENRGSQLCEVIITNIDISGTYEITKCSNIKLKHGDKLKIKNINKNMYFVNENEDKIGLVEDKFKNVLFNNETKFNIIVENCDDITTNINITIIT
jgi:DNA adenine methylase